LFYNESSKSDALHEFAKCDSLPSSSGLYAMTIRSFIPQMSVLIHKDNAYHMAKSGCLTHWAIENGVIFYRLLDCIYDYTLFWWSSVDHLAKLLIVNIMSVGDHHDKELTVY